MMKGLRWPLVIFNLGRDHESVQFRGGVLNVKPNVWSQMLPE